mgnify:CR=1 FL=1
MKTKLFYFVFCITLLLFLVTPSPAFCSVESSLTNIQTKLVGTILPLLAIIGLIIAGASFALGSPNAKQHMIYAIIGCAIGFGAQSIVAMIRGMVS